MDGDLPAVERLRTQDHEAFALLVDRYYGAVHRYLARLLADADAAAELVQETFLRAYRGLPRLASNSNVGAWLFRIATNLARQHHRHRRLIGWSDVSRLTGQQASTERLEEEVARHDLVRQALERLPLNERICLLLYAWSGYTCAEIGEILGKSTDAVRMILVRARRRFRAAYGGGLDWLDHEEGGSGPKAAPPASASSQSAGPAPPATEEPAARARSAPTIEPVTRRHQSRPEDRCLRAARRPLSAVLRYSG